MFFSLIIFVLFLCVYTTMAGGDKDFEYYIPLRAQPARGCNLLRCFFLSSFVHAHQIAKTRTWYFVPLLIGCLSSFPSSPFSSVG